MTTTTKTRSPLPRGGRTHTTIPGTSVTVYVQRGEVEGFRVWVEQGGVVDGWDWTYLTGVEARTEYDRAIAAFTAHRSWQGVERRLDELGAVINYQTSRQPRRMCDHAALAAAEQEYATLVPLGIAARLRDIDARRTAA